jgi:hypothetical protein
VREDYPGLVWCEFAGMEAGMRRPVGSSVWFCEFCGDDHTPVAVCKFCGDAAGVGHPCDGSLVV